MTLKITNPKISPEFVQELQDELAYSNVKAYSATHNFLRRVVYYCRSQEYAYIAAKNIKEQFDNYGIKYKLCLNALVKHDIIEVDRKYVVSAKTRGYKLTARGIELMTAGELVYLRSLFTDSKAKRKLQKQASYHRTKGNTYNNRFLEYIHSGRMRYLFTETAIDFIENSQWSDLTRLSALKIGRAHV